MDPTTDHESANTEPMQQEPAPPKAGLRARLAELNRAHNLDAIAAGCLVLIGAFLIFLSFEVASTAMTVVTGKGNAAVRVGREPRSEEFVALCVGDRLVTPSSIKPFTTGSNVGESCPPGERHPLAEVTRESWSLVRYGWLLMVAGSVWQMWLASGSRLRMGPRLFEKR